MHLGFHGGQCCGIKIIHGMGTSPTSMVEELPKIDSDNADKFGEEVSSDQRFFTKAAPEESGVDRLDRYIQFVRHHRPSHIIEIVLANNAVREWNQIPKWEPELIKRGFICVTKHKNSNSDNTCYIYHLTVGDDS